MDISVFIECLLNYVWRLKSNQCGVMERRPKILYLIVRIIVIK